MPHRHNAFRGSCQVGPILGHDGDECRVNVDGRGQVLCVICGRVYPQMTTATVKVLRALLEAHPKFPYCQAPRPHDLGLTVNYDAFVNASISWYSEHDLDAAEDPDLSIGRRFDRSLYHDKVPPVLVRAAANLDAIGARILESSALSMVLGNHPVPGKPALLGLHISLSFIP